MSVTIHLDGNWNTPARNHKRLSCENIRSFCFYPPLSEEIAVFAFFNSDRSGSALLPLF